MYFSPITIWLLVGVVFLVMEFSTIPGIGFLFLGLGALTTSSLMYFYPTLVDYQVATVGLTSLCWFLILWWPLKVLVYGKRNNKQAEDYFDMKGAQVKVLFEPISPGKLGQVAWSGTIMNARLESSENQPAEIDEVLYVTEVKGNILICKRKEK